MKYWISVVSRDHLQRGLDGGFMQANHGKATGLKRLHAGDSVIFYSPKTAYPDGEPLQQFTAIGSVADDELYQVEMIPGFLPWRRNVVFKECQAIPIRPLLTQLEFIKDPAHWGYSFRFGLFEISEADFITIRSQMLDVGRV